jgi:hypothetical protein
MSDMRILDYHQESQEFRPVEDPCGSRSLQIVSLVRSEKHGKKEEREDNKISRMEV